MINGKQELKEVIEKPPLREYFWSVLKGNVLDFKTGKAVIGDNHIIIVL